MPERPDHHTPAPRVVCGNSGSQRTNEAVRTGCPHRLSAPCDECAVLHACGKGGLDAGLHVPGQRSAPAERVLAESKSKGKSKDKGKGKSKGKARALVCLPCERRLRAGRLTLPHPGAIIPPVGDRCWSHGVKGSRGAFPGTGWEALMGM